MSKRIEDDFQKAVAKLLNTRYRKLLWFHTPNGGLRAKGEAKKFKLMGVKAGVPDVLILTPSVDLKYVGFAVELKMKKGRLSDEQKIWLEELSKLGYKIYVCYDDIDELMKQLDEYYGLK